MSGKKHAGGRPPKYKTAEAMEKLIEEYFDNCDNRIRHVYSKKRDEVVEMIDPEPYTVAGLCYVLDMDRDTLLNYEKKDEFIGTIKRAKRRVANDVERRLMEGAGVGAIFNLKNNFGYKDRTEVEESGNKTIEVITRKHSGSAITAALDEELDANESEDTD